MLPIELGLSIRDLQAATSGNLAKWRKGWADAARDDCQAKWDSTAERQNISSVFYWLLLLVENPLSLPHSLSQRLILLLLLSALACPSSLHQYNDSSGNENVTHQNQAIEFTLALTESSAQYKKLQKLNLCKKVADCSKPFYCTWKTALSGKFIKGMQSSYH